MSFNLYIMDCHHISPAEQPANEDDTHGDGYSVTEKLAYTPSAIYIS